MIGVTGEGGAPIPASSSEPNGPAPRQLGAPAAGDRRAEAAAGMVEEFVGEEAALAVGIGREIEEALGLLLEQVRCCRSRWGKQEGRERWTSRGSFGGSALLIYVLLRFPGSPE